MISVVSDSRLNFQISQVNCDYLKPTHNKQDFIMDPSYRLLVQQLAKQLLVCWFVLVFLLVESCRKFWFNSLSGVLGFFFLRLAQEAEKEGKENENVIHWIQCSRCLKWRAVSNPLSGYSQNVVYSFVNANCFSGNVSIILIANTTLVIYLNQFLKFFLATDGTSIYFPLAKYFRYWVKCADCGKYRRHSVAGSVSKKSIPKAWTCSDCAVPFYNRFVATFDSC